MAEKSNKELLEELGVDLTLVRKPARSPREERIIAGFEEIQRFVEEHGRLPAHGEDKDIFERLYATRLDRIRSLDECRDLLADMDHQGLLTVTTGVSEPAGEYKSDEELLAELGVHPSKENDVTILKHVKPRAQVRAAEEIASRTPCADFDKFRPIFDAVQQELKSGVRITRPFKDNAEINKGNLFILSGQKVYVAEVGEEFITEYDRKDRRLRVIFDNGTESDMLLRSLQRALNKDEHARRITEKDFGPLFSSVTDEEDTASGTIYVLRSKSEHPVIAENRNLIHKIGVTGGSVKRRIANTGLDPTFLMADVEIVATYELYNINRTRLENILHRFFEPARLDIQITDRFGNPVTPKEWFLVPLFIIDEVVDKIKEGTIGKYIYDIDSGALVEK
ncbi:MAG: GIY-YIG nuclease family protein [Gammaproteobacteria bacterium]